MYLKQHTWHNSPRAFKLLAWRVKKRKTQNTIQNIKTSQGLLTHKTKDILQEFECFYSKLYESRGPTENIIQSFLQNHSDLKQLTDQHRSMMDEDISSDEISRAIKAMKTNKTPGPDGFPVEFFRAFAELLVPEMENTFNSILHTGVLPPSWYEAEIIPVFKQGKDPQ